MEFKKVLDLSPNYMLAVFNLGLAQCRTGQRRGIHQIPAEEMRKAQERRQ